MKSVPRQLREQLTAVTKKTAVAEHEALINELRKRHSHSVQVVPRTHEWAPSQTEYTCFAYAFDLADCPEYTRLASRGYVPFASTPFVAYFIESGRLSEVPNEDAKPGDIFVYIHGGAPAHAAVLRGGGRVTSKWGVGNLYDHEVFEVPASYGERVRAFRGNSRELALEVFREFSRGEGFDEDE